MSKLLRYLILSLVAVLLTAPTAGAQTTINLVNQRFVCTGPLASLATNGFPVIVNQTVMNNHASARAARGAIAIESGCRGDGTTANDLVIHQYGTGFDIGAAGDPIVIFPGARNLSISGFTDCGLIGRGADNLPRTRDDAHQDGFDIRGGFDIYVHDYEMGDWDSQRATCHGAGGLAFISSFLYSAAVRDDPYRTQRVVFNRVKLVATKVNDPSAGPAGTAGHITQSVDSGIRNSCLSGNIPLSIRLHRPGIQNGAIRPINENNVRIDKNDGVPDNPALCPLP
jgi:hypothetical protein